MASMAPLTMAATSMGVPSQYESGASHQRRLAGVLASRGKSPPGIQCAHTLSMKVLGNTPEYSLRLVGCRT